MIGRWVGGVHPTLVLVQVFNEWKSPRAQPPMLCYEARPSSDRSLTMEKQRGRLLDHTKEIFFFVRFPTKGKVEVILAGAKDYEGIVQQARNDEEQCVETRKGYSSLLASSGRVALLLR